MGQKEKGELLQDNADDATGDGLEGTDFSSNNLDSNGLKGDGVFKSDSGEDQSRGMSRIDFGIEDLPRVGKTTAQKLRDMGYTTVNSIAATPAKKLQDDCGFGEKTAIDLTIAARELLQIGFQTGSEIWEKRKNLSRITTNSKALDEILGGGIETGSLTEFFGEYRTGKTQIMHQLCVNVQLDKEEGGLNGKALYIDSEGTFRPERIIQMSENLALDYNQVLANILYARVYSSDHQILLCRNLAGKIGAENIKLIVVDSLISHFRSEFIGRGTLAERQQLLNTHLHDLLRLADIFPEVAIVITNQVQSKPEVFFGDPTRATGGNIMAHSATIRVYLRKGKGEQRVAKIIDAPDLPEEEVTFTIQQGGIQDL